jgi:NAD(P)-dependent dehydrogenase (short-subunit alcohol dehydrogenase family)
MGAAAARTVAELGGELVVLDVQDVDYPATFFKVDLRDQASVDAVVDGIEDPISAVFACAGVADGTPGLPEINLISHRHIIERLLADEKLAPASSVSFISSIAGLGWRNQLERSLDFLAAPDWEAMVKWISEHPGTDSYAFTKQAINALVTNQAFRWRKQGVRLNAIMPGPTDTPLAQANAELWLSFGVEYRGELDHGPMTAEQMGNALVFLGSDAASGIAGELLSVDLGQVTSAETGSYPDPIVDLIKTF